MSSKVVLRLLFGLLLLSGIGFALVNRDQFFDASLIQQWVADAGAAGPVLFVILYALATIFFLPGSILTLLSGALFGPIWGSVLSLVGATMGATIAFLIARYFASDWAEQKSAGRLSQLKKGVEAEGWRFVAFVRLVPFFPFNLLNYALGLTRIRLMHYINASFVFMIPGAVAYTYLGYAGKEALVGGEGLIQKILLAIALLAVVAFLPRLLSRIRQKPMYRVDLLKKDLEKGSDLVLLDVRSPEEFCGEQGHVRGAINVPLEELGNRVEELQTFLEKTVYTICRTDRRSQKAAQLLEKNGFSHVQVIEQGMTAWHQQGFAVAYCKR